VDKVLIFAVLKQQLLQRRETETKFCYYNSYQCCVWQLAAKSTVLLCESDTRDM